MLNQLKTDGLDNVHGEEVVVCNISTLQCNFLSSYPFARGSFPPGDDQNSEPMVCRDLINGSFLTTQTGNLKCGIYRILTFDVVHAHLN